MAQHESLALKQRSCYMLQYHGYLVLNMLLLEVLFYTYICDLSDMTKQFSVYTLSNYMPYIFYQKFARK